MSSEGLAQSKMGFIAGAPKLLPETSENPQNGSRCCQNIGKQPCIVLPLPMWELFLGVTLELVPGGRCVSNSRGRIRDNSQQKTVHMQSQVLFVRCLAAGHHFAQYISVQLLRVGITFAL